jgi:hypothetical protein
MLAAPICHTRNCKHFRGVKEEEEPVVDGVRTLGGGTVICLKESQNGPLPNRSTSARSIHA